jgi:GT2 family glycosyltransferase
VADNASSDGTCEVASRRAPDAVVVPMGGNLGYSAAINAALDAVPPTRAAFVLNPDIRLGPRSVVRLLDGLDLPGTGITVPRLHERDGRLAHSLRREPSVVRVLAGAVLGGTRAGRVGTFGELVADPARYEVTTTADWASGAAMMISRDCLDAAGPWDESFFLYAEETEFALRARDLGFALRLVPDATAVHLGGTSHDDPRLWVLLNENRVRLYARRHAAASTLAFRAAIALNEGLRSVAGRPPQRAAHRAALRALLRSTTSLAQMP